MTERTSATSADGMPPHDPCGGARVAEDQRCTEAAAMRSAADEATAAQAEAHRDYADTAARSEDARQGADAAWLARVKEDAQRAYRRARERAASLQDLQDAAAAWLAEIDRLNRARREADTRMLEERERLSGLQARVEELAIWVDATRMSAESAERACREAREALARCEKAANAAGRSVAHVETVEPESMAPVAPLALGPVAHVAAPLALGPVAHVGPVEPVEAESLAPVAPAISAAAGSFGDGEPGGGPRGGEPRATPEEREPAPIFGLLDGDRRALRGIALAIADNASDADAVAALLQGLSDAIHEAARKAGYLDFPDHDPFWGSFPPGERRAIAGALAALGHGFDGSGGFTGDRPPDGRQLAMALGHAGHDPMRVRNVPSGTRLTDLYREVSVAAGEYVTERSGSLSLSETRALVGSRASSLGGLWERWDRIREALLGADPAEPS
ncbi:hypothetical protein BH20CHL6_BH20CHL6_10780 [soil metagenome]